MAVNIVGSAHSPFGRLDGRDLESLISGVTRAALAHAGVGGACYVKEEAAQGLSFPGILARIARRDFDRQGARAVADGSVFPGGRLPVNPSGGLVAKGHPIGATGVSMHVLAAMQLMGEAGDMRLPGAELAGVFNMGGSSVTSDVSILERSR